MPSSFVILPVGSITPTLQNSAAMKSLPPWKVTKVKDDERQEFLHEYTEIRSAGGGDVWIAKSSAGAKGFYP